MQGQSPVGEFADDALQRCGIEVACGGAECPQGGAWRAEFVLHFLQTTGLLQGAETFEGGVEEGEQDERGIVVEEETAIAGAVTFRTDVVKPCQERLELLEVLQAGDFFSSQGRLMCQRHGQAGNCRLSKWPTGTPNQPTTGTTAAFMPNNAKSPKEAAWSFHRSVQMPCRTLLGRLCFKLEAKDAAIREAVWRQWR